MPGASPLAHEVTVRRLGWKRPFDLTLSVLLLAALSPLIAVVAMLVWLDSGGPILFVQQRVGAGGSLFPMFKFRSMYAGASDDFHRGAAAAWFTARPEIGGYKSRADPRVTRLGRFIRGSSIDELPQLFNVILGHMSLVGPRPAIPYELDYYRPEYFERFQVPPGMTGLWQVSGRDRCSAPDMMDIDGRYVRHCSLGLDVKVLLLTVPAALRLSAVYPRFTALPSRWAGRGRAGRRHTPLTLPAARRTRTRSQ